MRTRNEKAAGKQLRLEIKVVIDTHLSQAAGFRFEDCLDNDEQRGLCDTRLRVGIIAG